jgi:hypothetical protein
MNKTIEMSVDQEGVTDLPVNSGLAFLALFLAIVGLLAIVAPSFAAVCLAAVVLGFVVLLFSRMWELNALSVNTARLSVYLGLFCGLCGIAFHFYRESLLDRQAIKIASQYLQALSSGDRNLAIAMNGLPKVVEEEAGPGSLSPEQKAVRNFLNDPTIKDVIERGLQAKWTSNGILSKHRQRNLVEFQVRFFDESSTNSMAMVVNVRTLIPYAATLDQKRQWSVDKIHPAPL